MPLEGIQHQPRDIAKACFDAGWVNVENLTIAVAVCLAESQGFDRAYNDNVDSNGTVLSRDVGAFEINIPGSSIGTPLEENLYDFLANVHTARDKWLTWSNDGQNPIQGWNHWVAYSGGIALDPNAKGHYIHRACRGVGNFLADQMFHIPDPPLLFYKGGAVRL